MKLVGGPTSTPLRRRDAGLLQQLGTGHAGDPRLSLPPSLTVGPAYGLIVLSDQPLATRFGSFMLSERGQAVLQQHGLDPIGLP